MTCSITINSFFHDSLNPFHEFLVSCALVKTSGESLSVVFLETFHIFAVSHHFHTFHYLTFVVTYEFEGEEEEMFEMQEDVWFSTLHEFDVIFCQFEGCFFEIEVTRRTAYYETEIYVDYVTTGID